MRLASNEFPMALQTLLALYCLMIVLMSTVGGQLPSLVRMSHLRTQLLISFVGGLMLGIAFLHLFPHAVATLGSASKAGAACLGGVVAMFVLLRAFHAPHTHGFAEATPLKLAGENELVQPCCGEVELVIPGGLSESSDSVLIATNLQSSEQGQSEQEPIEQENLESQNPRRRRTDHHHEHCDHSHHDTNATGDRWMGWLGILFGLWLHTLIDGVALAASTVADAKHPGVIFAGLGTFLAIALHKPLDAFTITSTMRASGWSSIHQAFVNVIFALACPAGALLFYFGVNHDPANASLLGWGLAVSAGFFICIALADLLPEVSFHQHDRGKLSVAFFLGIALAIAVESLPGHSHVHASDRRDVIERQGSETVDRGEVLSALCF